MAPHGPTGQLASDAATDLRLPSNGPASAAPTLTVANNTCSAALLPSPSPLPLATAPIHSPTAGMNRFPDGTHVWLRSRVRRGYLHADEDGSGVSLSTDRATLNAAWQVHRIVRQGVAYILLRCAAYGRYLGPSPPVAQPDGHRGRAAVSAIQRDYSEPMQVNIRWRAQAVTAGDGGGDYVLLYHWRDAELYLRANGRYRRWNTGVTVAPVDGNDGNESTMMHWTVEHIPPRPAPPALPAPTTVSSLSLLLALLSFVDLDGTRFLQPVDSINIWLT